MNRSVLCAALACVLALPLAACGGDTPSNATPSTPAPMQHLRTDDYPDAVNVYSARKKGAGDEVTVVGRVRLEVEGSGAFTIIDEAIEYCGQGAEQCGCKTPWDYCCELDVVPDASLAVEIHNAEGIPIEVPKADMRLLDLIAIKGTLTKTESGGLVLVSKDGWFRRDRPTIPEGVEWPE